MQKFKTLTDAIALSEFAHRNQVDKAGLPYIEHPKRVLAKVQAQGALPYVQMAAVLHDVTEDTAFTPAMLLELGIPESAVEIVKLLDRDISKKSYDDREITRQQLIDSWSGLDPDEFGNAMKDYASKHGSFFETTDEFYYYAIKKNPGAVQVKLADIEDNLSPWRLTYLSDETRERLKKKYAKALEILNA